MNTQESQTYLTAEGFQDLAPTESVFLVAPASGEVSTCRQWITRFCGIAKTAWAPVSSYTLKHVVERSTGTYVSNGAFILACQELEVRVERIGATPNAMVGLNLPRRRSPDRRLAGFAD